LTKTELEAGITESPNDCAPDRGQTTPNATINSPSLRKWVKPFTLNKSQAYITGSMQKFCAFGNLRVELALPV
jgi:hypothetical protein